mmetsp:Transcript_20396/g.37113  ORF Transcript_20396/g.37113 Transcript_20396/m.37113 type:complete len:378 (-) Transcript_20396:124-1257(-)
MGTAKALLQGKQSLAALRKEYATAHDAAPNQVQAPILQCPLEEDAMSVPSVDQLEPVQQPASLDEEWAEVENRTAALKAHADASAGKVADTSTGTEVPVPWLEVQQWLVAQPVDEALIEALIDDKVASAGIFGCLRPSTRGDVPGLSGRLQQDKNSLICFKMTSFDLFNVMHFRMLRTLYTKLTRNRACPTIGGHWEVMGFQHTDPRTDINRSGGLLNIIHLAWFLSSPQLIDVLRSMFVLSQNQDQEFPLALVSINITSMVLKAFATGHFSRLCNSNGAVLETTCKLHAAGLWFFQSRWKSQKRSIREGHMQAALQEVEAQLVKPQKLLGTFQKGLEDSRQKNQLSKLEFTDLDQERTSTEASRKVEELPKRYLGA